ncbi:hypothetical protein JR316_0001999 [Psilocybe cubensis]|uniref:Protein phosphatase n=2 Tax=Psilocybe cubensis TaxID=181762 RepID=A0A8H7Y4I5_PSICU|nr:hypothetical protein JR316_0001999 [Psilocybe cubensis]KAH9485092.1 hypothetical protein JR316_0001999 [Psilocybe cubensis]
MSRMRQRLLVLPRVRSNSLSTLTAQPPTSTSRPVLTTPPRLPSEAPKQSQHSQLALTQPAPANQPPLTNPAPLSPPLLPALVHLPEQPPPTHAAAAAAASPRAHKRQRLRYQLDVGAYGIPKHRPHTRAYHSSASPSTSQYPHTALSVQVGEDSYFVCDNAMGIADGVGGWSRSQTPNPAHPTPSALFSRRLMHFCAAEIEALDASAHDQTPFRPDPTARPPTTHFSFTHHLKPRTSFGPASYTPFAVPAPPSTPGPFSFSDLQDSLTSSLEELEEGIDILRILERAYDSTVKVHHLPPASSSIETPIPLTTGSSTALLAVLDHPPPPGSGPLPHHPPAPEKNYALGSVYSHSPPALSPSSTASPSLSGSETSSTSSSPSPSSAIPQETEERTDAGRSQDQEAYDAVLRIAHLGDCMGMLVRGDAIAWRSDEMWWGYNHPLQLGPPRPSPSTSSSTSSKSTMHPSSQSSSSSSTSTTPTAHALPTQPHTCTLPVRSGDILILASDGLSDNLWDEDVLDEVVKVRAGCLSGSGGVSCALGSDLNGVRTGKLEPTEMPESSTTTLRRRAFAGMLAEALCSRAKRVSETRPPSHVMSKRSNKIKMKERGGRFGVDVIPEERECEIDAAKAGARTRAVREQESDEASEEEEEDEVPFARRARLAGRSFRGGKSDDISVVVALISPTSLSSTSTSSLSSNPNSTSTKAARL